MTLRINTNIQALNAHKNLTRTDNMMGQSLERLSSGLRINRAADDASGLAIADNLRAQHTGLGQAIANANDGINVIQIADGALEESINIVNTIRTKAIQSASDAQSDASREAIQADVDKLLEELEMIGDTTAFNGINLLDGSFTDKKFHVGAYKDETVQFSVGDARGSVVGAMAYANTSRETEAAVSKPFFKGDAVTSEALSEGDLRINGIEIGSTTAQFNVGVAGTTGGSTAMAKAAAINAKVNETGVQAKATTETIFTIGAANVSLAVNGLGFSGTAQDLATKINNDANAKSLGIRAEYIADGANGAVKIIGIHGQALSFTGITNSAYVNGMSVTGVDFRAEGTLTLSNARAMTQSTEGITETNLSAGDLTINGVDVAQGGSLAIQDNDADGALYNAINNNATFQRMGVRAEYVSMDGGTTNRIRIISDNEEITIGGADPSKVHLTPGTTDGIQTNGIVLEGAATDTDMSNDNYLAKIGFSGAQYGSYEPSGVNNELGNDKLVLSSAFLKTDAVSTVALDEGDLRVNGVEIEATGAQYNLGAAGTTGSATAMAKAAAINAKVNETGVQAKATTETIFTIGAANVSLAVNGLGFSGTAQNLVTKINNNANAKSLGIRAEYIEDGANGAVKIIGIHGQALSFTGITNSAYVNGVSVTGVDFTAQGTLTLSNARAMVGSEDEIVETDLNAGDFIINGVDIAAGGTLNIQDNDMDGTLLNAINDNKELQMMGIRAEYYSEDGGTTNRVRLISENDDITISGSEPSKLNFVKGTTEGTTTTEIRLEGAAVDADKSNDNYLAKIGLSGGFAGTTEADGVNNSGGNDILYFGMDRMQYNSGDISINGYNIGQPSDDGISHALGDRSAAAWAEAVNSVSDKTGVEADIIKASQTGAGAVTEGILQQRDLVINGIDIVRDNTGGSGMQLMDGDADQTLMNAINEYKDQTGVIASIDDDGKLVLDARDGRNIHVESTSTGNKYVKFAADFGKTGVAQDSVYMGNVRLVSDEQFTVDGAGSNAGERELSLGKVGLAGGGAATEATSDLKGDGTILAGLNYDTAIANVDVTTQEGAEMAIRTADYALKRLDEIRSGLGSVQNQLTSTVANISVTKINVQSTESTIRDVDFAAESTTYSKMQVLMQAGTYAQSQANSSAQNVMRLLQ